MRTCKGCVQFISCLRSSDVVVNIRGGDHICENYFEYPDFEGILEVKRKSKDGRWSTAMFYRNGTKPTFAQYGSEINDVVEWRRKQL